MNNIVQAICTNGVSAVLLFSLILNYVRKDHDRKKENTLFLTMLFINLAQCIIETVTLIIDGMDFNGAVILAKILNAALFANNIIFAFHWSLYADTKVGYDKKVRSSMRIIKQIPAFFIVCGAIVNIFHPVFFSVSEDNIYRREWGFTFAFVITYVYLILGTVVICLHRKKMERYNFLPVFTFLFPVFGASLIQYLVPGISLLWAGSAIGLTSAYMSLLDENSVTDKLSGLYSRHYMNQYLSILPNKAKDSKQKFLGLMLDIDGFKQINDKYGHLVGDDAIVTAAKILKRAVTTEKIVFRFAGDEFVVIMPIHSEAEIPKIIAKIHNITEHFNLNYDKQYVLRFSVGYAVYDVSETPISFLERMDAEMYKDKRSKSTVRI